MMWPLKGTEQTDTPHPTMSLGEEKIIARTGAMRIVFPLSLGKRVDRAARFHQRARDG